MKSKLNCTFTILFIFCSLLLHSQSAKDKSETADAYLEQGNLYLKQGKLTEAENYFNKALVSYKANENKEGLKNTYLLLSKLLEKKKDFVHAYTYYELYTSLKDTLLNQLSNKQILEMSAKYESEKKEKDIELLTKDKALQNAELNKQRFTRNGFIIGLSIALLLAFLLYRRYITKQKLNIALSSKNGELTDKNLLIETQNERIIDSINYAQHIQQSILVDESEIQKMLPDSFIYFKPKDIVSGDFYWCSEINNKIIIAAIDCTGHGVPGAFMSMIGTTLLNQIVNEKQITQPAEILYHLNIAVYEVLHQENDISLSHDGMDIALCSFDFKNRILEYAGAQNSLYMVQNDTIEILIADKQTIGSRGALSKIKKTTQITYTNHSRVLKKDTLIYLFTDGYTDQFGGEKKQKFGSAKFKELILNNQHLTMQQQKEALIKAQEDWQGDIPQIDDILVIGIKL